MLTNDVATFEQPGPGVFVIEKEEKLAKEKEEEAKKPPERKVSMDLMITICNPFVSQFFGFGITVF